MRAAANSGTVRRVVLTSSIAAMHNSRDSAPADAISPPSNGSLYTTEDWNNDANIEINPYPASKVIKHIHRLDVERTDQDQLSDHNLVQGSGVLAWNDIMCFGASNPYC